MARPSLFVALVGSTGSFPWSRQTTLGRVEFRQPAGFRRRLDVDQLFCFFQIMEQEFYSAIEKFQPLSEADEA
jgi:hypothetical protein